MNIRCKKDYLNLLDVIKKTGEEVKGTYELPAFCLKVKSSSTGIKEMFEISDEFEHEFVEAISTFKSINLGPYDTSKYLHIIPAIKAAMKQFVDDSLDTRRCVIHFPPEHCFQAVQFLVRENTVHVVCFMRSCDAVKNLPYDIWLCSIMGDIFNHYITKVKNEQPYKFYNINMVFGSLHAYKEDL